MSLHESCRRQGDFFMPSSPFRKEKKMTKPENTEYKTYLTEEEMPTHYYNLRADMYADHVDHAPMLNPATLKPVTVDDLSHVFSTELAK